MSRRIERLLMRLLPSAFRDRFGDDLRDEWQPQLAAAYARVFRSLPEAQLRNALKEEMVGILSVDRLPTAVVQQTSLRMLRELDALLAQVR